MLTVKELKPRVFEVAMSGLIEKSDIKTMERHLTPALDGEGPIGIVVRAEALEDLTADALAEDARYEFSQMTKWSKVAKLAIVTDKQAFEAVIRWVDPILPMIDMKSFGPSDGDAAEAFASDLPSRDGAQCGPGFRLLEDGSNGVIAYEVDGKMTQEGVERVFAPLEVAMKADTKVNLLVKFVSYEGFDLSLMTDRDFLSSKFGAIDTVKRYAVVGAPSWMKGLVSMMGPIMPFEMRMFDLSDEADARHWVGLT